ETDHGQIARGMGAYGVQVRDPQELPGALREAIASGKPAIVDVVIDRGPSPDDFRASPRRLTET
ncbi:MAG: thiamine pyrophosphate-dependent enzyme, partial [Dehalococcoidia bacterium]